MKKIMLFFMPILFFCISCADKKKEKEITPEILALGEQLFADKTCVSCHMVDKKAIGPSIQDIVTIYSEQNASLTDFFNGTSPSIVDTKPGQVAIMKASLIGILMKLSEEEQAAIAAYMQSTIQ